MMNIVWRLQRSNAGYIPTLEVSTAGELLQGYTAQFFPVYCLR